MKNRTRVGIVVLAALGVMGLAVAVVQWAPPGTEVAVTTGITATPGATVEPATPTATPTPTETASPTPTPTPAAGELRLIDGLEMIYVPEGEFLMGSNDEQVAQVVAMCRPDFPRCTENAFAIEQPQHVVWLDGYWIGRTEVTNAQYVLFLNERAPSEDELTGWIDLENEGSLIEQVRGVYRPRAGYADHPVVAVSRDGAEAFARWWGGRLPTEAQWEKAARGTDGRIYPWGDTWDARRANTCDEDCKYAWRDPTVDDGYARTSPVDAYPEGASPYGVLDTMGNVLEWTADWYDTYGGQPERNPTGPLYGGRGVVRGGCWGCAAHWSRCASRQNTGVRTFHSNLGFRVASPPVTPTPTSMPTPLGPEATPTAQPGVTLQPTAAVPPAATPTPTPSVEPTATPFHITQATKVVDIADFGLFGVDGDLAVGSIDVDDGSIVAIVDLTTGEVRRLDRPEESYNELAHISGRWVVWSRRYRHRGGTQLMVYDLEQERQFQVEDARPRLTDLSGDVVVWYQPSRYPETEYGFVHDVFAHDLATGERYVVAQGPADWQYYPRIAGPWVIYARKDSETKDSSKILYMDLRAHNLLSGEDFLIGQIPNLDEAGMGTQHAIAGDKVLWVKYQPNTYGWLHVYDLTTRTDRPLPPEQQDRSYLKTFGDEGFIVGSSVYSLEDGHLIGTLDFREPGDMYRVILSGNRVVFAVENDGVTSLYTTFLKR